MNIDRDDEYATRYEAAPTIEEQIEYAKYLQFQINNPKVSAILASLEKLAALESQPVPVEPEIPTVYYVTIPTGEYASVVTTASLSKWRAYIDTLQSALHRAQEERDKSCELLEALNEKSTALISVNERLKHRAEKAEATNQRMVELLKEPSEGMIAAGYPPNDERAQSWDVTEVFKAMSAELLKEVEKSY